MSQDDVPDPKQPKDFLFLFYTQSDFSRIMDFRRSSANNWVAESSREVFIISVRSNSRSRPFFRSSSKALDHLY